MSNIIPKEDINIVKDKPLKKEQIEAIQFMLKRTSAIISLQTGLGKTLSSLTAMEHLKRVLGDRLLTIILAPKNAIISFSNELENFDYTYECDTINNSDDINFDNEVKILNTRRIGRILSGEFSVLASKEQVDDIVMISYSKIVDSIEDIEEIIIRHRSKKKDAVVLLIVDEAHTLSSPKTQRTKTCLELRKMCNIVWALTATPVKNKYEMLYHICNFVRPKYIANSMADFMRKFCEVKKVKKYFYGRTVWIDEIIGRKNEDELRHLLSDLIIHREIKYNLRFKYVPITLNDKELDMYDEVASDRLGNGTTDFSSRCIELQKLVDNVLDIEMVNELGDVVYTKKYRFKSKEDKLIEIVNFLKNKGYTTIVYTDFLDTISRLEEILNNTGCTLHKIIGATSSKRRKEIEEEIKVGDVILITSAGTASLNLQKANTIVFYNVPYSTVNVVQAIGRITRLGSSYDSQNVIFLYCLGTIDEYKIKYFKSNSKMISDVIGKSHNVPKDLEEHDKEGLRDLKSELLWQYRSKKNKVRRIRRKALMERVIVTEIEGDKLIESNPIYNLTGDTLLVDKGEVIKEIRSVVQEKYGKAIDNIDNIGYYKSKIRELFATDDRILKTYVKVTKEGKTVVLVDNPKYQIGKYMKKWMIENWRILEEGVGKL